MNAGSLLPTLDAASLQRAGAFAIAGGIGGALYFASVWRSARALATGARMTSLLLSALSRFILLGLMLALAAWQGATPLLATAAGVMLGRAIVMRRAREAAP